MNTTPGFRDSHYPSPSGIVVGMPGTGSQHKNKARALSLLNARLLEAEQARQRSQRAETGNFRLVGGPLGKNPDLQFAVTGHRPPHRIALSTWQTSWKATLIRRRSL